jgi:hypothetical protein
MQAGPTSGEDRSVEFHNDCSVVAQSTLGWRRIHTIFSYVLAGCRIAENMVELVVGIPRSKPRPLLDWKKPLSAVHKTRVGHPLEELLVPSRAVSLVEKA